MPRPRVRFAPSPTGYFHVGGGRTALFNWLYARQHGGVFILRVEDTDADRNRDEHIEGIERAMRWLGLDWDEGPYFQSQRGELYRAAIEELLVDGHAYACDCTTEAVKERTRVRGGPPGYDGFCRDRGLDPTAGYLIRFRTPDDGVTVVTDLIRGRPEFPNSRIDDFAIRKSNGQPLFILANAVDDADMRMTHVIRGEEHLSNTPKYELLWSALGYGEYPVFAHLPLLHNEQHQKLSKRRGHRVAVEDFRDEGFLPEAMRNYLVLLGWSPGDNREILTVDEMIAEFRLEHVKSAPAIFDHKKLLSINAEYIRALRTVEFVERSQAWLRDRWAGIAPLVQERVRTLGEAYKMVDFLYLNDPVFDEKDWAKGVRKQPAFAAILDAAVVAYESIDWHAVNIEEATRQVAEQTGVAVRDADRPIRLAVTGRSAGPPLFQSLDALGRERTMARLRAARARLD